MDRAILRRAAAVVDALSPGQLPVLLDAMAIRSSATLDEGGPNHRRWKEFAAFAQGAAPGPEIEEMVRVTGTPADELLQRLRASAAAEGRGLVEDAATWEAVFVYHSLVAEAIEDRFGYFCTEEVTALVDAGASGDLLTVSLSEDELPSPNGVAYLWNPAGPRVLLWAVAGRDRRSVRVAVRSLTALQDWLRSDPIPRQDSADTLFPATPFVQARLSRPGSDDPPMPVRTGLLSVGFAEKESSPDRALMLLLSLAHMIRQERLVDVEDQQYRAPVPPSRRRHKRARRRTDTVTYLSYRPRSATGPSGEGTRTYTHRWVVRGHWRRQWYPTLQRHKPIWITEHIAGPDDTPIVVHDKVGVPRGPEQCAEADSPPASTS